MKVLVLGGTRFLGRYVVDDALACGHELTQFSRGRSDPAFLARVEQLRGEREAELHALH